MRARPHTLASPRKGTSALLALRQYSVFRLLEVRPKTHPRHQENAISRRVMSPGTIILWRCSLAPEQVGI